MNKMTTGLLLFLLMPILVAGVNPTVSLQTATASNPYPHSFALAVTFSEPVVGFSATSLAVANGTVASIAGADCQPSFSVVIQPTAVSGVKLVIPAGVVTSLSSGALNLMSNTINLLGLNPSLPPSSNFDLKRWSLTLPLPLDRLNDAISIGEITLNGVPSTNTGYSNPPYFFTDPMTGAMNFFAPLNGGTTPNSAFARSELLEVLPGSSPTWKLSTFASNTLSASLLISEVPPIEQRMVIGQIHDKGTTDGFGNRASNSPFVKVYYDSNPLDPNKNVCNGCVYAQIRIAPSQSGFFPIVNLINNVPLNTVFDYQVVLLRDGTLTIQANGIATTTKVSSSNNNRIGWGAQNLYFKAGVYNLERSKSTTLGGAAGFYSLQVNHV